MKKATLPFFILLIIMLSVPLLSQEEGKETKTDIDQIVEIFLSTSYLDSESCGEYRSGEKDYLLYRKMLLDSETFLFPKLMKMFDEDQTLNEIQGERLYSLLEEICAKHPKATATLTEDYPGYYPLIAACRTAEAMEHLADEANGISGSSGFAMLIDLLLNSELSSSTLNDDDKEKIKMLLILLAVDGEHFGALEVLIEDYDEGMFLFAGRLMEIREAKYFERPFLTEDYVETVEEYLGDDLDSDILGMVLGYEERRASVKKRLAKLKIAKENNGQEGKWELVFKWYLETSIEKKELEPVVLKKYMNFTEFYKIDRIPVKQLLAKACADSADKFGLRTCSLIWKTPALRAETEVEVCVYPELSGYQKLEKIDPDKPLE